MTWAMNIVDQNCSISRTMTWAMNKDLRSEPFKLENYDLGKELRSYQCPPDSCRNLPESGHSSGIKFGRKAC